MLLEILQLVIPFLLGGGLWGLVTWRQKRKKLRNEVAKDQFNDFGQILDNYINRMSKLGEQVVQLTEENANLQRIINEMKRNENSTE